MAKLGDQQLAECGFETRAIHVGQAPEPTTGAVTVPIYQTSTYVQEELGRHKGYEYSRTGNPTRTALETCLASLENGRHGLAFASGLAATTTSVMLFKAGDHILCANDVYGGTYRLFVRVFEGWGLKTSFVEMRDLDAVRRAITPQTRALWIETPTNPLLKVLDIAALSAIAREHDALTVVDNTFASPYLQRPLEHGADIVLHSTTKYLGGHSDVIGGALVVRDDALSDRLHFLQNAAGGVPGPFDCWLVLRGIKTLAIRMRAHSANGQRIAEFLARHPKVERVHYPGLPDHPGHGVACRQMSGFGGMVSFEVKGGLEAARRVVNGTRLFSLAESLGGVESLIEHPATMTHASVAGSSLEISPSLIRLSIGIERAEDLLADLEQALG